MYLDEVRDEGEEVVSKHSYDDKVLRFHLV